MVIGIGFIDYFSLDWELGFGIHLGGIVPSQNRFQSQTIFTPCECFYEPIWGFLHLFRCFVCNEYSEINK
jgi:hypothetical protein